MGTAARDAATAGCKEAMQATYKQISKRFANAREKAADHYQMLQASHAEATAVLKSHTSLLTSFRAKIAEREEGITSYKKHVDELYGTIQSREERLVKLQEGQGRNLDRLKALLELVQSVRDSQPTRAPPTAGKARACNYASMNCFKQRLHSRLRERQPSTPSQCRRACTRWYPRARRRRSIRTWSCTWLKRSACSHSDAESETARRVFRKTFKSVPAPYIIAACESIQVLTHAFCSNNSFLPKTLVTALISPAVVLHFSERAAL